MLKRIILYGNIPLLIINAIYGIELRLEKRITLSQDEVILMGVFCLAVTEDEILILPDAKEGDIKLYDNNGKIVRRWGRRGLGPDEFGAPFYCDYEKPYYMHLDAQKSTISIFKRTEVDRFIRLYETLCLGCMSDVHLFESGVMIDSYAVDSNGKKYALYYKDFNGKNIRYILPLYLKYGFESESNYEANFNDISPIGTFAYFYIYADSIFYVWEGRPKILRIDLKTNRINAFGQESPSYTKPKVTKGILEARRQRRGEIEGKEKEKMSWIRGVFANEDHIFLYFVNFDSKSSLWKAFLQIYDLSGNFIKEERIPEAISYQMHGPPFYYNKVNNRLYFLSISLNQREFLDEYVILRYKILK